MHKADLTTTKRLAYAPGLDGLRAVACLAVIIYHLGWFHMTGGFLGVTVFFTLSGYLITSLLLDEFDATQTLDLRGFWRRRIHRIIPLFWTVSVICGLIGLATGSGLGRHTFDAMLASFGFAINWLMTRNPDFAGVLGANWSVAVEEQFYLAWPLILWLLLRTIRNRRLIASFITTAVAVLILHRWSVAAVGSSMRVWVGTDTQADALLIGCAVALGFRCRSKLVSLAAGVVLLCLFFTAVEGRLDTFRLLMPTAAIATALLLPYLQDHGGFLAWGPLAAVGRRSYGLYLWSSPIGYVAQDIMGLRGPLLVLVAIGGVFAVAEATYRFVELPMRARGRRRPHRNPAQDTPSAALEAAAA